MSEETTGSGPPDNTGDDRRSELLSQRWKLTDVIAIIALLLSIANFWRSCHSENQTQQRSDDQAFLNQALGSYPRLQLKTAPHLKSYRVSSEIFGFDSSHVEMVGDTAYTEVNCFVDASISFVLKNEGSGIAKLRATVWSASNTGSPFARDLILGRLDTVRVSGEVVEREEELVPGDTILMSFAVDSIRIGSGGTLVHCLVLYENELGNLYDTYFCIPLKAADFTMLYGVDSERKLHLLSVGTTDGTQLRHMVSLPPSTNDLFKIYTRSESMAIRQYMETLVGRLTRKL